MAAKGKTKAVAQDPYLIERVQTQGGITFADERTVLTGCGYETCIHIYKLPSQISDHWLMNVCDKQDTIVTVDLHTEDVFEVKRNLNRSMQEQSSRYSDAQTKSEEIDAEHRYAEMDRLLREISTMGEIVKTVHIRIYAYARTAAELDSRVKEIMKELESDSYMSTVYLNEQKDEWLAMWQDYDEQMSSPFKVHGMPITSEALAAGDPFHFSSLEDERGDYLGNTPCGGNVIFDEFEKNAKRLYYNAVIVGEMGSGKSTLLKKRFLARAIRGDYVRTFDISGEFTRLTDELGGKVIRPDGTSGILNPLEILASGDNENVNFTRHISKVSTIYKFLVPTASVEQVTAFQNNLREMYDSFGLSPDTSKGTQITGRPASEYPVFSDFLAYLTKKIDRLASGEYNELRGELAKKELVQLADIKALLENVVNTYGSILDGHTSLDNVLDEQIVTFDISQLKEMDSSIFDAQIFNMLSLCWDNCVKNGSIMKELWENDKIAWEDIVRFLILIDESHRWINTNKMQAVELVTLYMREARKYFGGIFLASQSIRDFVPEGSDGEKIDKLKNIFELTQYKFIFRQNSNVIPIIDKVFNGVLTDSQRAAIPRLSQGNTVLAITSDTSLQFKVYLSNRERKLFSGGA